MEASCGGLLLNAGGTMVKVWHLVALVVKELKDKNLEKVIAAGKDKLGSMPAGGGSHK